MKFSDVIEALESGKKLQVGGASPTFQLAAVGARRQLVQVFDDGSWQLTHLEYRGPGDRSGWSVVS